VTVVLGMDTATPSTAVAVLLEDGRAIERRDDPAPGERPRHASRLLELAEQALADAGTDWEAVTRLAVGVGPGGFTGLRIGIATARALAQARELEVVGVGTLHALAAGAADAAVVLAVLDARRGEAFAAAFDRDGGERLAPVALAHEALEAAVRELAEATAGLLAVGDGAVRFREQLERAGATVPADGEPVHRVSAVQVCRLGAAGRPADREALVPDYIRDPDAKPPTR
jgi:tRNA threonylcarbamoyladenosine biosynthesis protein TsaB